MGVVDDGDQELAGTVQAEGLLDQQPFTAMIPAIELDLKGLAENAQSVVVGVKRAVDHGGNHTLGIVRHKRLLQNALAGAGFTQREAETALLGMDTQDVRLRVRQFG